METTKILVVDDEARMRKLVKDFLLIKGYKVLEAADGEQAVEMFFQDKEIGLIILDVMMPKMDGWEVCKTIRKYSQVPIVMLTARSEERDELLGLNLVWTNTFPSHSVRRFWLPGLKRSCAER